ncbi:SET domain-containing protein, partial [Epithele typhae]|uniref:SET domain-containing protein n=1 Tax=Epithele typhae TaxID=378194 RepID=UPI002007AB30
KTVATIPKAAILSVRTCSLTSLIPWVPYGHAATLALSFALYSEMIIGDQSRWHGYLQSLPSDIVPIARLWAHREAFPDDDTQQALRWLEGTEVHRELSDAEGVSLTDEIDQYYISDVAPILRKLGYEPHLRGFLHAYSLVSSRAFLVDAYHGLSMVPLADAFNHTHDNHVQLASEYDVCPHCGSLSECAHDDDSSNDHRSTAVHNVPTEADTVDMVTVRSIGAGEEVFNTYGASLGNAALLARYGFILDGGETDVVTFGWPGSDFFDVADEERRWRDACDAAREDAKRILEDSDLVYFPDEQRGARPSLSIDSDAQVSIGLLIWAVNEVLAPSSVDVDIHKRILALCSALQDGEEEPSRDDDEILGSERHAGGGTIIQDLVAMAHTLLDLFKSRLGVIGQGRSAEDLGLELDALPPHRTKTRLALHYVLGERAIIETCTAQWQDIHAMLLGRL